MQIQLLIVLSQTAVAFQTTPIIILAPSTTAITPSHAAVATCLRMSKLHNEPQDKEVDDAKKLILPPRQKRRLLSKMTTHPLSALTQLKKDERNKFNKQRLLKMGITIAAAFLTTLTKSTIARAVAATPLWVTNGAVVPLISAPGFGLVEMPGMRGISPYQVGGLPNQGAMYFALSLFVATALLRSAGGGYVHLVHFMAKYLGKMIKDDDEKEDFDLGLPKEVDWGTYSHSTLDPLQKKRIEKSSSYEFDKHTMLFEPIKTETEVNHAAEDAKLQKGTQFFQEQKYKQHHHPVHTTRSKYEKPTYLDTLPINEEAKHDTPTRYLDTLTDAKRSTWDVYKHQLDEVKPLNEVDELKDEVSNLHGLMQIEQSMYQTSNHALKLAMEAQNGELQHSSTKNELKEFDQKLSTHEELKEFDKKAQEYEETIMKDATKMPKREDGKKTNLSS